VIRINLLPPEITQKRKDEKRWRWIVMGSIAAFAVVGIAFAILQVEVSMKASEVASIRQQAEGLQQEAQRFQVFRLKEDDLKARQVIADKALAGRMDWSGLYSDVALVLPGDIYLVRLATTEPKAPAPGTFALDGRAIDYPYDVPDLGYKSVAKLLVRLAELPKLQSVWLGRSVKPPAPSADSTVTQYIAFDVTAKIPGSGTITANAPGVPAPPVSP
jgi:Tfp pilus assembly protein PilN